MKKNYKTPSTNTRKIRTTILCGSNQNPSQTGINEGVKEGQSFGFARERNSGSSLSF